MKKIIIIISLILLIGVGYYFRTELITFYDGLTGQSERLNKISLDSIVSLAENKLQLPPPLRFNGSVVGSNLTRAGIIIQTNRARQQDTLKSLVEETKLDQAASVKAQEMFKLQYFDHISPNGDGPAELAKRVDYGYIMIGENLAMGNFADDVDLVKAWLASPGHRENILDARYSQIGVAVVKGTYQGESTWIAVQEFGLPLTACPKPDPAIKATIDSIKIQTDNLANVLDNKQLELKQTDKAEYEKYNLLAKQYNSLVGQYKDLVAQIKSLIASYNMQVNAFNQCAETP